VVGYWNVNKYIGSNIKAVWNVWLQHNNILISVEGKIKVIVTKILQILLCFK